MSGGDLAAEVVRLRDENRRLREALERIDAAATVSQVIGEILAARFVLAEYAAKQE